MTLSPNLYYAVLAMDAYNRFQRPNDPVGLAVVGSQVGNAIRRTDQLPDGYQNTGFFATAYDLGGRVVISYRGTDFQGGIDELAADVFNGWIASFGTTPSPQLSAAELFYETVAQRDVFEVGRASARRFRQSGGLKPTLLQARPLQTSGLRVRRAGKREKSRSAVRSSLTPCCRHSAAMRASCTAPPTMRPALSNPLSVVQ